MILLFVVKYQYMSVQRAVLSMYVSVQCCETLYWYGLAQCCGGADVGLWPSQLLREVHIRAR